MGGTGEGKGKMRKRRNMIMFEGVEEEQEDAAMRWLGRRGRSCLERHPR